LKIQPLVTGNGDCTTPVRAGTGLKLENDAFEFIDKTIVQNFLTHQVCSQPVSLSSKAKISHWPAG
jgi:hypothetical protein